MDVRKALENYKKNEMAINIAVLRSEMSDNIKQLQIEKQLIDTAIECLDADMRMLVTARYKQEVSVRKMSNRFCIARTTILRRLDKAIVKIAEAINLQK